MAILSDGSALEQGWVERFAPTDEVVALTESRDTPTGTLAMAVPFDDARALGQALRGCQALTVLEGRSRLDPRPVLAATTWAGVRRVVWVAPAWTHLAALPDDPRILMVHGWLLMPGALAGHAALPSQDREVAVVAPGDVLGACERALVSGQPGVVYGLAGGTCVLPAALTAGFDWPAHLDVRASQRDLGFWTRALPRALEDARRPTR